MSDANRSGDDDARSVNDGTTSAPPPPPPPPSPPSSSPPTPPHPSSSSDVIEIRETTTSEGGARRGRPSSIRTIESRFSDGSRSVVIATTDGSTGVTTVESTRYPPGAPATGPGEEGAPEVLPPTEPPAPPLSSSTPSRGSDEAKAKAKAGRRGRRVDSDGKKDSGIAVVPEGPEVVAATEPLRPSQSTSSKKRALRGKWRRGHRKKEDLDNGDVIPEGPEVLPATDPSHRSPSSSVPPPPPPPSPVPEGPPILPEGPEVLPATEEPPSPSPSPSMPFCGYGGDDDDDDGPSLPGASTAGAMAVLLPEGPELIPSTEPRPHRPSERGSHAAKIARKTGEKGKLPPKKKSVFFSKRRRKTSTSKRVGDEPPPRNGRGGDGRDEKRRAKRRAFGPNVDEEAMADAIRRHRAGRDDRDDHRDGIDDQGVDRDAPGAYVVRFDDETEERLERGDLRNSIPAHRATTPEDPPTFRSVPRGAATGEDGGDLEDVDLETGSAGDVNAQKAALKKKEQSSSGVSLGDRDVRICASISSVAFVGMVVSGVFWVRFAL